MRKNEQQVYELASTIVEAMKEEIQKGKEEMRAEREEKIKELLAGAIIEQDGEITDQLLEVVYLLLERGTTTEECPCCQCACDECEEEMDDDGDYPWDGNYIQQFMDDFDLEIGEIFAIADRSEDFSFDENYILINQNGDKKYRTLFSLLRGDLIPIKLEFDDEDDAIDWQDVPQGVEIEVRDDENLPWVVRTFIACHNGNILCERSGSPDEFKIWNYARLID